jgi:hypothetical protein
LQQKVKEYEQIAKIRIKSSLFSRKCRDPSSEANFEIERFIQAQKASFNAKVANTFDLPSDQYIKFEFIWIPNRVTKVADNKNDYIGKASVRFRSNASVTLLYLKSQSLIYFETSYLTAVTSGCGTQGNLMCYGGRNHSLEEIYFNKINTVGAFHEEERIQVASKGCSTREETYNILKDGFIIRAGNNFNVVASEKYQTELSQARRHINEKISKANA